MAEYLRRHGRQLSASDRRLLVSVVEGYDAAPIAQASVLALSTAGQPHLSDADRAQFRPVRGYGSLIRKISEDIDPSNCRMRFSTAVERIEWRKGRVRLHGSRGEVRARRAVITLPVGVLSASRGTRGAVAFAPEPRVVAAVRDGLAMGDAVRIVLRFRQAFWRNRIGSSGPDHRRVEPAFLHLPSAAFPTWWTSAPVEGPVLTAWAGGPAATALLRLPREQRLRLALVDLSHALNLPLRQVWRAYRGGRSHDWTSDPFSRGAYSYVRVGGAGVAARLRRPIEDTLYFAGEACGRDETGTVAAALESGREAAARILN
jgi:monoamine oxidase